MNPYPLIEKIAKNTGLRPLHIVRAAGYSDAAATNWRKGSHGCTQKTYRQFERMYERTKPTKQPKSAGLLQFLPVFYR